jgi:hypothetical protein
MPPRRGAAPEPGADTNRPSLHEAGNRVAGGTEPMTRRDRDELAVAPHPSARRVIARG